MYRLLYVNDIIRISNSMNKITTVKEVFGEKCIMQDLNETLHFLGMNIEMMKKKLFKFISLSKLVKY